MTSGPIEEEEDPSVFVISASALESLSPEDAAAAAEGMAKINAMDDLINSGADAVSDPDGALMVTSAINSIIGGDEGASDGSVGLEVADKAVKATEVIWKLETFSAALSVYKNLSSICNKKCFFWLLGRQNCYCHVLSPGEKLLNLSD